MKKNKNKLDCYVKVTVTRAEKSRNNLYYKNTH